MTFKQLLSEIVLKENNDDAKELVDQFFDLYWEAVNSLYMFNEHYNKKDREWNTAYKKLVEIGNNLGNSADKQGYR